MYGLSTILLLAMFSVPLYRVVRGTPRVEEVAADAPSVAVAKVKREDLAQELVCDGELRPYLEIDLHAKVAGYLENINVDIGDRVETGQLIAKIEIPELGDDIKREVAMQERSQQEVARTEAAYEEAHAVFTRLMAVNKAQPKLIAQQELDEAQAKDRTTASALAVTRAEVNVAGAEMAKLQTMLKYTQITAPFAGIITKRYADPGTLIQAGTSSSTQTLPLVRLSQNDRLRLDIPISVSYVSRINVGDPVEIRVEALEKTIQGTIARSTRKVEAATRTMEVEVDVPNPDLRLIPGMYASVVLRVDHREKTLAVPVEAVSRQKTSTVFVVNPANKIEERVVRLGLETARELEVLSGLKENELVMIGSRTQLKAGQQVEPKLLDEVGLAQ
jgi:RND family efflux transporter MFP subunit